MLYKRCGSCGKKIPYDSQCSCVSKRRREYNKQRYNYNAKSERFYHSSKWKLVRSRAIIKYYSMDIYEYFTTGRVVEGKIMHHIVEVKDDFNKADDINNLIYLTDSNHKKIHALYEKGEVEKKKIQEELTRYIKLWEKEFCF